mgnify:CR=1 FL=1
MMKEIIKQHEEKMGKTIDVLVIDITNEIKASLFD